jgi:hypothetical protein
MADQRVRIAVVTGGRLRGWESDIVRRVRALREADVVAWMHLDQLATEDPSGAFGRLQRKVSASPQLAFEAHGPADLGPLRVNDLRGAQVDLALLLGAASGLQEGPWDPALRRWAFRHGDDLPAHRALPGLRESVRQVPLTRFGLVDAGTGRTLRTACLRTAGEPGTLAAVIAGLAAQWPAAAIAEWAANGQAPQGMDDEPTAAMPLPGLLETLAFGWRRMTGRGGAPLATDHGAWNIGVLHQPVHVLLEDDGSRNVRWLPAPSKGKARMEPFGYHTPDGDLNVLFRKCSVDGDEAVIARVRPKPDNILKRSRTMLEGDGHAAYPYTLTVDGAPAVILGDGPAACVRIHRINDANDGLLDGRPILSEALHAPTLFEHDGRWWLLGTKDPLPDALLYGYYSDSPWGPFVPIGHGPLKCDVRSARPAGSPFLHDGALYRPALDASAPGAPAVSINRVDRLSPAGFREEAVRRVQGFAATAYGEGVRTITAMGQLTLVDGLLSPVMEARRANGSRSSTRSRSKRDRG